MKIFLKTSVVCYVSLLLFCCSSDDNGDCTKTITISQFFIINNQSYNYDITQEVFCDVPEPTAATFIEPPALSNFSYEVINFEFTPDTGNNTSRLQFEIRLVNSNEIAVTGFPLITWNINNLESKVNLSNSASIPCNQIEGNSDCILTYDLQSSLDTGVNSIELLNVEYILSN